MTPKKSCAGWVLAIAMAGCTFVFGAPAPNPQEIVQKSVTAIQADWAQAPNYTYLEHDIDTKHHSTTEKTYRVLMIDGSPYNFVTAIGGEPLSPSAKAAEQRKLQHEIYRRQTESPRERAKRIAKYDKDRHHDHEMLQEMVNAFQFHLAGEAEVNGHSCWVLDAEPKPGYEPVDHEGRVLKGMKGRLWIDKPTHQWVKVRAQVVHPVDFYGFVAKVEPGTEFDLEQEPAAGGFWFPKKFNVRVNATALGFLDESSVENDTYRDYQPMPQASALLQSVK